MKLIAIDPWANTGPGFNRHAADAVHKAMSEMDEDTALVYGRILVADSVRYNLIAHRDELAKAAGDLVAARTEALRKRYTRNAVDKARTGQDNSHEINCLVQIAKAESDDERRANAALQPRSMGGRFIQDHIDIVADERKIAADQDAAAIQGIPTSNLTGEDLSHYQQAYSQIRDMLAPFHQENLGALVHLKVLNVPRNVERTEQVAVGRSANITGIQEKLASGDRIQSAEVSVNPLRNVGGAVFDTMSAIAGDRTAGYVSDAFGTAERPGVLTVEGVHNYNTAREKVDDNENFSGATRAFGQVARGSSLLLDSLGPAAPLKLQYALAVANHVGQFGPEAQKVFGPAADRAAYRYRGTERDPDPKLVDAFQSLRPQGATLADLQAFSPENRKRLIAMMRERAIKGKDYPVGVDGKPGEGWDPKAVLRYFRTRLPDPDLNELQRRSGVIPPSEGIVIDDKGMIAHQSIGYADDWYLPFNLRHLAALNGGEYIRTRSFGGPTTEDIYTGLVTNARSLTVVSHSGVWTVEFDRNFRGGRRFNDKAARMVARYGHLLDAVGSRQVSRGGITPSRQAELRAEARKYDTNEKSDAFKARLRELEAEQDYNPQLSQAEKGEAALEWLRVAAADTTTADERTLNPEDVVAEITERQARKEFAAQRQFHNNTGMPEVFSLDDFRAKAAAGFDTNGNPEEQVRTIAAAMVPPKVAGLDRALEKARLANAERAKSLRLDGAGYTAALTALHEQFPYYIHRPIYHPWRDMQGIKATTDRTFEYAMDTGYVAPRYNRPAAAEAGYFNTDVMGVGIGTKTSGKVKAQSTRYQNYPVGHGKLVAVGRRDDDPNDDPNNAASLGGNGGSGGPAGSGGPVGGGTGGGGTGGTAGSSDMQRAANLQLLDEVLANKTFVGGKAHDGFDLTGRDIRTEVAAPNFSYPQLTALFHTNTEEQLKQMPDADLRLMLESIGSFTEGAARALAVNSDTLELFKNKGAIPAALPPATGLRQILDELGKNHNYPGPAYDPRRLPNMEEIEAAYKDNSEISRLAGNKELPKSPSAAGFKDAAKALEQRLRAAQVKHLAAQQYSRPDPPAEVRRDENDAHALSRALQLRSRWEYADKHKPEPPPEPDVENKFVFLNQGDIQRAINAQVHGMNPNDPNVVNGN